MEKITMVRLIEFYAENGYERGSPARQRVSRLIFKEVYPVYAQSKRVRYIEEDVAAQILEEVPPASAEAITEEEQIAEDTEPEAAPAESTDSEELLLMRRDIEALQEELRRLRGGG